MWTCRDSVTPLKKDMVNKSPYQLVLLIWGINSCFLRSSRRWVVGFKHVCQGWNQGKSVGPPVTWTCYDVQAAGFRFANTSFQPQIVCRESVDNTKYSTREGWKVPYVSLYRYSPELAVCWHHLLYILSHHTCLTNVGTYTMTFQWRLQTRFSFANWHGNTQSQSWMIANAPSKTSLQLKANYRGLINGTTFNMFDFYISTWVVPVPRIPVYIFSRGSQPKPSFATDILGGGTTPMFNPMSNGVGRCNGSWQSVSLQGQPVVWQPRLMTKIVIWLHPPKQTWNLKMDPWKRRFLLETIISRFHVNFWGCNWWQK